MNVHQAIPISQGAISVISQTIPHNAIIVSSPDRVIDRDWLNYFDIGAAYEATAAHIAALPGTKNTPEKHTLRAYESGLQYYIEEFAQDELPTEALIKRFIAHLSRKWNQRTKDFGLSATTISSKYLAPLRIFLKSLAGQHIVATMENTHIITNYREQIRAACVVKNPAADRKSDQSALMRYGERLTKRQVNKPLGKIDRQTLNGKRDYALLVTAFNTALRLAELQRITLSSISEHSDDVFIVTVRGKRNNHDPVTITDNAVDAINEYVQAYNDMLPIGDIRRIGKDTPLWQSLTRSGNILNIGHRTGTNRKTKQPTFYKPSAGMSQCGITGIIRKRVGIAPHDVRRTFAYLASKKMPIAAISRQMRHSSVAVTEIYIGDERDYNESNLANYITLG